jgi:hypothetical protein
VQRFSSTIVSEQANAQSYASLLRKALQSDQTTVKEYGDHARQCASEYLDRQRIAITYEENFEILVKSKC